MRQIKRVGIIGGGIIGLLTCVELCKRGYQVTVFDKGKLGGGASHAALGSLTPYSDHEVSLETRNLAKAGLSIYPELVKYLFNRTKINIDFEKNGVLECAFTDQKYELLKNSYETDYANFSEVDWLESRAVRLIEPNLSSKIRGAVLYKAESTINVSQLLRALIDYVERAGVEIRQHERVVEVFSTPESAQVVTEKSKYHFDCVIVCPGIGLSSIQGIDTPITIDMIRGDVVEIQFEKRLINSCIYSDDAFMTPMPDGRIFLGSNYSVDNKPFNVETSSIEVAQVLSIVQRNLRLLPLIQRAQLNRSWKNWRPKTQSGNPFVGHSVASKNLIYAVGFYGLGITVAPAVAQQIAFMIKDL